ncbi:MAG TPA: 1-(5-phosphoribosyl)-5-[(5-phosphoribosylamino)methylideneamino]imidazole-4-carboxamide isomerase [Anaeromyxobacteraceae bacterium]|jgi:phosphoribosylformimino-5-aminoimidazole carboxamide ribotide isomerase|nr:1-(5-phosphoribosyl)-5-[(5-phosphoribosylamino)methylideneamino]imidazole-4-carboxamide isomerase [Anaeromyxobacteraceae bacterium]
MIVIPAIDLMGGRVVRLRKGDFDTQTVYSADPAEVAEGFRRAGARRLHVVDLDGARAGHPVNGEAVRAICEVELEVEVGGGLRTLADLEAVFASGVHAAVVGTAAVSRLELVQQACQLFPGRIHAAIDAKGGEVAVKGWEQGSGLAAVEVAKRVRDAGVALVEYTDVARDGMFTGVDAAGAAALQRDAGVPVVASGGVASLDDVRACLAADLAGVIIGKALYEKRLELADALRLSGELA